MASELYKHPKWDSAVGCAFLGGFYNVAPWPVGSKQKAAKFLREGASIAPTRRNLYYAGVNAYQMGEYAKAVTYFDGALKAAPCKVGAPHVRASTRPREHRLASTVRDAAHLSARREPWCRDAAWCSGAPTRHLRRKISSASSWSSRGEASSWRGRLSRDDAAAQPGSTSPVDFICPRAARQKSGRRVRRLALGV
eukprot:1288872-Prymnesium_polylepis.1